jgi:hypothetical protein
MVDELLVPHRFLRYRYGHASRGTFGNDDPGYDIHNESNTEGKECDCHPDEPDHRGINIQVFAKTGAHAAKHPALCTAI